MAFVYSCCFWFSLRLGGILIGIFSLLQATLALAACCIAHNRLKEVQDEIGNIINMKLIYTKDYLENFRLDPGKYITLAVVLSCIYIIICVLYIYGAYTCNNVLMIAFILVELVRLVVLSLVIATWLLVLKQNTMDIGLLIGASVASGFFLLGMFYLWVCAANLPVLINEIDRDEQAATIDKLQQLLETKPVMFTQTLDNVPLAVAGAGGDPYRRGIFMVTNRDDVLDKSLISGSRISVPFYNR